MAIQPLKEGFLFPAGGKQVHRTFGQETGRSEFESLIATLKHNQYVEMQANTQNSPILSEYGVELSQPIFVTPLTNRDQVVYRTNNPQVYLRVDTGHFYNNTTLVEWVPKLLLEYHSSMAYLIAVSNSATKAINQFIEAQQS